MVLGGLIGFCGLVNGLLWDGLRQNSALEELVPEVSLEVRMQRMEMEVSVFVSL
jgi:hypothetical protein